MTDPPAGDGDGVPGAPVEGRFHRVGSHVPLWLSAAGTLVLFLFAVQLLGAATDAAAPLVRSWLGVVVATDAAALGLSWLVTYALTNGSVVAALSLSLFAADLVPLQQAFLMVVGSRLGAAAIVVVIGALDYLQKRPHRTLREGTSLGVLTFLITFSIYLPAGAIGTVLVPLLPAAVPGPGPSFGVRALQYFEPLTRAITGSLGPGLSFLLAVALLFASLHLFDRVLAQVETETIRTHVFRHFRRRWMAFGIGVLITGVTTSVAFSLGVVVPLYNREFVRRREVVPYVLGANLGTLFDTIVVGLVLESPVGTAMVLLVLALATGLTVLVLLVYDAYYGAIGATQDRLLADRRLFVAFGILLVVVPLALVVVPRL